MKWLSSLKVELILVRLWGGSKIWEDLSQPVLWSSPSERERGMPVWNQLTRAAGVLATAKGVLRNHIRKVVDKNTHFYGQAAPATLRWCFYDFLRGTNFGRWKGHCQPFLLLEFPGLWSFSGHLGQGNKCLAPSQWIHPPITVSLTLKGNFSIDVEFLYKFLNTLHYAATSM